MRQVRIRIYENGKHEFYEGKFHQWGFEILETNEGNTQYSIGIVELPDGSMKTPLPTEIIFLS